MIQTVLSEPFYTVWKDPGTVGSKSHPQQKDNPVCRFMFTIISIHNFLWFSVLVKTFSFSLSKVMNMQNEL